MVSNLFAGGLHYWGHCVCADFAFTLVLGSHFLFPIKWKQLQPRGKLLCRDIIILMLG